MNNTCADCGKDTARGSTRCTACRIKDLRRQAVADMATQDAEALAMREDEKLTFRRMAARLHVSPVAARNRVMSARKRRTWAAELGVSGDR